MNILDALDDEQVFAPWFRDPETWQAWRAFLAASFALPMTQAERELFEACTGRTVAPGTTVREAWLVCGRRAGKSFILAVVAVYLAVFVDYRQHLSPGERATVLVVAADRRQARVIMRYTRALVTGVPMIAKLIERETTEEIELSNRVVIEVATASSRTIRGYTVAAALLDELAFWRTDTDAADPDHEIIASLRPAMATIPTAMMLCASSPYARRGALFNAYRRYFGDDEAAPLVWQADTRSMNPTVPQRILDEAYEDDAASASAEYGAMFRDDLEDFVTRETVEACVEPGMVECGYDARRRYVAFVDPSGGSRDSMTLAIAHAEDDAPAVDLVREAKAPFAPEDVVVDFCDVLKDYRIRDVTGDKYAGTWPAEQFAKRGIRYNAAAAPKSDLYRDLLPLLNGNAIRLPDNRRLVNQISSLERRTARGGRDSIDHPPRGHDDLANAVAGVASLVKAPKAGRVKVRRLKGF